MSIYFHECFITKIHNYALLDEQGDIRATAFDVEGIIGAKERYGWGKIVRIEFDGKTLKIGKEIK